MRGDFDGDLPSLSSRRLVASETPARLKSLAGIIQSLTYAEMQIFAQSLHIKINEGTHEIPEILLEVSASILKDTK